MVETAGNDLEVQIGVTLNRLSRQLAQAEARFTKAAQKVERDFNRSNDAVMNRAVENYSRANQQAARSLSNFAAANSRAAGGFRDVRSQIQNAAFQVGDFAVQVGAGTSASQALAQQLPQLLGAFGAVGAVLGALVAIGIPSFTALMASMRGETVDVDKALDDLSRSLDVYQGFVERSAMSTAELAEEFGTFASNVRGFASYMAEVSLAQTMDDLATSLGGVRTNLDGVIEAVQAYAAAEAFLAETQANQAGGLATSEQVLQAREAMEALGDEATAAAASMGLTTSRAVELSQALNAVDAARVAGDMIGVRDRAFEVLRLIEGWYPAGIQLPPLLSQMVVQMNRVVEETAQAAAALEGVRSNLAVAAEAATILAGNLAAAQAPANNLLGTMQALAAAAWQAAQNIAIAQNRQRMIDQATAIGGGRGGDPRTMGGSLYDWTNREAIIFGDPRLTPPPSAGGGGSGGGGGGRAAAVVAQTPEYWDRLVDSVREGEAAWADYNATVERGAEALTDFFGSILDGSKSAKEALGDLLMQMGRVALQQGILGLGQSGGTMGSLFSMLGTSLTPSFEGGGFTGSGPRVGGIDGRGGFPAIVHPDERIIDMRRGGAGGGGGGRIELVIRQEPGAVAEIAANTAGAIVQQYDRALPGRVARIQSDRRAR